MKLSCLVPALAFVHAVASAQPPSLSVADYASVQEALDRNPGRMLYVPPGDHVVAAAVRISHANSGLWGPGRIVQSNPDAVVIEIVRAPGAQLRDITVTRAEGRMECGKSAVTVGQSADVVIAGVRILDNWANANALAIRECPRVQVRDCLIQNYSRIAIDDRTKTSFLGYAFRCIDGTGMSVNNSVGGLIANNRVVETRMRPTPELKAKHELGKFTKKNPTKGWRVDQEMWDSEYFAGWHQGSAIVVNSAEVSDCTLVIGNYIENAGQGIDLHTDHAIVANNMVVNAFIGMKAIHGSKNVIISANQFVKSDLWAIGLMPGTASHRAGEPAELSGGRRSSDVANIDGYHVVANNIISDFGYGQSHWNWPISSPGKAPIRLGAPDFAAAGKPPVRDVIVQGNIVYDTGRDQIVVDGRPRVEPPRYRRAVLFSTGDDAPQNIVLDANVFHPGTEDDRQVSPAN